MQPTILTTQSLVNPTSLPYTETTRTSGNESPSQIIDPGDSNRVQEASNTDEPRGTGLNITFNPLVIAFIVIGAFLFVTLIVLVFVLIFCLRRKSSPRTSKTRPRRLTDVESVGEFYAPVSSYLQCYAYIAWSYRKVPSKFYHVCVLLSHS